MREYLFIRHFMVFFVIGYVLASQYGPKLGRSEFYPFSNWSFYSYTHSIREDIVVFVSSVNGTDLKEPTIYFDVPNRNSSTSEEKIRLRKLLRDLWRHHRKGNEKQVEKLLKIIKSKYFSDVITAEFEVVLIKYNPIERLKSGKIEYSRTILKTSK